MAKNDAQLPVLVCHTLYISGTVDHIKIFDTQVENND